MMHEVLFYCHILYFVLPNMCIMYLLIHNYGIVLALSCGLNCGVSNHSKNVHFMSVVPVLDLLGILQPRSIVTYNLLPLLDSLKEILSFIIKH